MQKVTSFPPTYPTLRLWTSTVFFLLGGLVVGSLIFLGIRYITIPDPYIQAVLDLPGVETHGESLFELNCAACHGTGGIGRVGPSLRGVSLRRSEKFLIEQVTGGNTPPMPQFQPDPQEMADLLSYLKSL